MKTFVIICLSLALSACASDEAAKGTPKSDYEIAKHKLSLGRYNETAMELDKFSAKHPYSHYSEKAELLRAFAAYKGEEYILTEVICEEFIRRHPRHPDVAYAKYLLAMSHYKQVSPSEKDQSESKKAIEAFKRLLKEHPKSNYASDGARRLQKLYNHLAKHEVAVGKFYFDKGKYVAASNRFQTVIKDYQTTPSIEEALYYLAASYAALDIRDSAHSTARLLLHNYPNGKWSRKVRRFL